MIIQHLLLNSLSLTYRLMFHSFLVLVKLGLAERTGLEPATSAVTGQRSNQLSYRSRPVIQPRWRGGRLSYYTF